MVASYRAKAAAAGLRQHWFHAVYLLNLATTSDLLLKQSIGSLVYYMDLAGRIGADGVVFHPGSHKGAGFEAMLPAIAGAMREVLRRTDSPARLVVENSAGQGGCVGCTFDEVAAIVDAVQSDRLGLVHANDSRAEFQSNVDRHANIGDGYIGSDAFGLLLNDRRLRHLPWVLEVPGELKQGPDLVNVNRLRALAGLEPVIPPEGAVVGPR